MGRLRRVVSRASDNCVGGGVRRAGIGDDRTRPGPGPTRLDSTGFRRGHRRRKTAQDPPLPHGHAAFERRDRARQSPRPAAPSRCALGDRISGDQHPWAFRGNLRSAGCAVLRGNDLHLGLRDRAHGARFHAGSAGTGRHAHRVCPFDRLAGRAFADLRDLSVPMACGLLLDRADQPCAQGFESVGAVVSVASFWAGGWNERGCPARFSG